MNGTKMLPFWLAGACALMVTDASAAIRFARLPEARLSSLPNEAPKAVPGHRRTPGIVLARGPKDMQPTGPQRQAFVATNKARAKAIDKEGPWGGVDSGPGHNGCFTVLHGGQLPHVQEFANGQSAMGSVWSESAKRSRVSLVRSQSLDVADGGDTATLTVTDAFVDAHSLGVQSVGASTLSLSRVAGGPGEIGVYAARDGQRVHFVVTAADASKVKLEDRQLGMFRSIQAQSGEVFSFSDCGFMRVSLDAAALGGGRTATVMVPVILGTEEVAVPIELPAGDPDRPHPTQTEAIVRRAHVHLSASRAKGDRAPVVSVRFGWAPDEDRHTL